MLQLAARRMSSLPAAPRFWLLKGEPESHVLRGKQVGFWPFSRIAALPTRTAPFFGVRNPQARSFLRDALRVGDRVFYYHASCKAPGVYGVCRVARAGYPDDDALDAASPFFDAKHSAAAPRWFKVDLEALDSAAEGLARPVLLAELRADAARLGDMVLLKQPRLSVQPVAPAQWARVLELSQSGGGGGGGAGAGAAGAAGAAVEAKPASKKRAAAAAGPEGVAAAAAAAEAAGPGPRQPAAKCARKKGAA
jgi:predicted RNA-binding protein with PUA-like domain